MAMLEVNLTPALKARLEAAALRRGLAVPDFALTALETALREEPSEPPKRSIMEFYGVGREALRGLDVDAYIREMRNEWDGGNDQS